MSYGETYRSVRDDGIPVHILDILPGSSDEAEFLKQRAVRITKELCRIALKSDPFDWFSRPTYEGEPLLPEAANDTRDIAPVIHLSEYRHKSSFAP